MIAGAAVHGRCDTDRRRPFGVEKHPMPRWIGKIADATPGMDCARTGQFQNQCGLPDAEMDRLDTGHGLLGFFGIFAAQNCAAALSGAE